MFTIVEHKKKTTIAEGIDNTGEDVARAQSNAKCCCYRRCKVLGVSYGREIHEADAVFEETLHLMADRNCNSLLSASTGADDRHATDGLQAIGDRGYLICAAN